MRNPTAPTAAQATDRSDDVFLAFAIAVALAVSAWLATEPFALA